MIVNKDREGNIIEVGDLVLRANQGNLDKHIVLKITKSGIYLSNNVSRNTNYRGKNYSYTFNGDVDTHNYRHYVGSYELNRHLFILQKKHVDVTPELLSKYKTKNEVNKKDK